MTWLLLAFLGCHEVGGTLGLADCTVHAVHTLPDGEGAWLVGRIEYDHLGRVLVQEEERTRADETWVDRIENRWEGPLLVEEAASYVRGDETGVQVDFHGYDDADQRVRSEVWRGTDGGPIALEGVWSFDYDANGLPAGGTWDEGDDGTIDGVREERWEPQVVGFIVETSEVFYGLQGNITFQERDARRRLVWKREDLDGDGEDELFEQRWWEGDALAGYDLAGPDVVDQRCDYDLEEGHQVGSRCRNELFDGVFRTRSFHRGDPARPYVSVLDYREDGESRPQEVVELEWDCR